MSEGLTHRAGDIRAYDIADNRLLWNFHTIPRPGESGYDMPPGLEMHRRGQLLAKEWP
ncbi:MAG: hypothetical protein U1G07_22000 [Verrucomicrobiota bacterium]